MRCEGFIIGGFASVKWYYKPLQWWLKREQLEFDLIHPGPFGLNVWPLDTFLSYACSAIERTQGDLLLVGHSLGGIQSIYLADLYPDRIRKVFAVGTPVWGCPQKVYEDSIRTLLNQPIKEWERFQQEIVPRQASKLVTISCENDLLAPRSVCVVAGATNYVVTADNEGLSSSHLLLPYLNATLRIICDETRAIENFLSL